MHNAVMCTLSLYDVIGTTCHLHIKLKSFSNIAQSLHKEAVHDCSFLYIITKKSVIMSEAFLDDVGIYCNRLHAWWSTQSRLATLLNSGLDFRLYDGSDLKTYLLMMPWLLSGPPGFTCWISSAPIFSFMYCWVLIFALSHFYILIYTF